MSTCTNKRKRRLKRRLWSALKPARRVLEIAIAALGRMIIPYLPRKMVVWVANFGGLTGYLISKRSRRLGMSNLKVAFGEELSLKERRRILRRSFQVFALLVLDLFWFSIHTKERIARHVKFDEGMQELLQHKAQICITGHFGNWELLGQAIASQGYSMASVATPLKNLGVDRLFIGTRTRSGQTIIPRDGAVRGMLRQLARGGKVALLLDQNTLPSQGGGFVRFFGLPVPVSLAAAVLGFRVQADITISYCMPQSDGTYLAMGGDHMRAPHASERTDEERYIDLTQQTVTRVEEMIRKHPEYWLWAYKRWKFIPDGTTREGYPDYARPLRAGE